MESLRQNWIRQLGLAGVCLVLGLSACNRGETVVRGMAPGCARGFNVLLVTLDTTRADRLGCYGARNARTPNIDALAARGTSFGQAITCVPLTTPSHASILTGLYPPSHGVRNNGEAPLGSERLTLAEILRDHGYQTAAFVSSFVLDRRFGLDQGFAVYDDSVERTLGAGSFGGLNERRGDATADAALAWLAARNPSQPFLAWVHFYDAHEPYSLAPPFDKDFRGHEYDGEIAFVDAQVGRLVAGLKAQGLHENTVIAIVADHGESLGEHGESTHGRTIYDAVMRVPWILVCPAAPKSAGLVANEVVSTVDLMPSLLDALGIDSPPKLDGHSLLSTRSDPERAVYIESMMTLLNNGWAPLQGMRSAHAKFIRAPRSEFFDLDKDPFELADRGHEDPKVAARLSADLEARRAAWPKDSELLVRNTSAGAETQSALSSLGYTSATSADGSVGVLDPKDMLPSWELIEEAIRLQGEAQGPDGQRKLAEAMTKVQKALDRSPNDRAALEQKARIFTAQGRLDDAARALRQYISIRPSSDAYVFLAQLALARRKSEEVEPLARAALALEPGHGGAHIALGDLYMSQSKFDAALAEFESALKVDPVRAQGMAGARIEAARKQLQSKGG
ncbi:MAG TPA: sulfatase-like hydrolase/transferase [Planctomycetota bacterium]|nr:sulfatase-like hydrolase/transferase [Planctomycetota bacterium]